MHGLQLTDLQPVAPMSEALFRKAEIQAALKPISSRKTYWGEELLLEKLDDGSVWKRLDMNPGTQSSLEYHVRKREVYMLLHGDLDIGIRIGRAENHTLHMRAGDLFKIPPGLAHMRIAKTSVVLIEWASSDDPKDSHIIQDGRWYEHVEGPADERGKH